MTYFTNVQTLEELRKEYKRLVKQNHPDNGGSLEAIKTINVEYEISFHLSKMPGQKEQSLEDRKLQKIIFRRCLCGIIPNISKKK